jgi:biopolymer transport protein TolQ
MQQVVHVFLATAGPISNEDPGLIALVADADFIVQFVLLVLVGMSISCWVIIFDRVKHLYHAHENTQAFLTQFWNADSLDDINQEVGALGDSPVANVFLKGYSELGKLNRKYEERKRSGKEEAKKILLDGEVNLQRAMRRAAADERTAMEHMVTFLATTGSTAPFIGLFGTVWGILRAFQKIGATGQASIQTVGPDIAHALIATAVGLAAAIPAVIAYNFINRKIRVLSQEMDNFTSDFLNIIKRNYLAR